MKQTLIILSFFIVSICFGQNTIPEYSRDFIIFKGCDDAEDKERCYEIQMHELLASRLNKNERKAIILSEAKKDTITVHTSILYDERGKIVDDYSSISAPVKGLNDEMKLILEDIPLVKPVLDLYDNGVAKNVNSIFGFLVDRPNEKIVPIMGYTPAEVPFAIIEKVPVYRGCDEKMNNKDLKKCMSTKVAEHVSKNFRIKLAKKLNLDSGIVRIFVAFKVDKDGKVIDIMARAPHQKLEEEAKRVIRKIPKLTKPGYQKGKAVIVPYALPIVFNVTN